MPRHREVSYPREKYEDKSYTSTSLKAYANITTRGKRLEDLQKGPRDLHRMDGAEIASRYLEITCMFHN